jgi:hypothetical protein
MESERKQHEYVRTSELAREIEAFFDEHEDAHPHQLARRAGVSPRAISKTLARERPFQTVWFADRIMLAMGRHISELRTHFLEPKQNKSRCRRQRGRITSKIEEAAR